MTRTPAHMLAACAAVTLIGAVWTGETIAAATPDAIAQLQPGLWTLRDLDGGPSRSMCVADPSALLQVEHRAAPCARTVLSADTRKATVHYVCPASGFGRTALRVQTPRLARIDTQGISGRAPFARRLEARRTGDCGGGERLSAR